MPQRASRRKSARLAVFSPQPVNVGSAERWISAAVGGALAAFGASRRSWAGAALAAAGGALALRGLGGRCPLYRAAGVSTSGEPARALDTQVTIAVNRPPEPLFVFWRHLPNLPRFLSHLTEVRVLDATLSRWTTAGPLGKRFSWDAEITQEEPGRWLAWRSLSGDIEHEGSVHFRRAPGDRGTFVTVHLRYRPPAGRLGHAFAKLLGEAPKTRLAEDLRRFRQLLETGELATAAARPPAPEVTRGVPEPLEAPFPAALLGATS